MARFELGVDGAGMMAPEVDSGESYFRLGLLHSTGMDGPPDRVLAHKWFNVAAARGYSAAAEYRREIAAEMAADEVRKALRLAREFLTLH